MRKLNVFYTVFFWLIIFSCSDKYQTKQSLVSMLKSKDQDSIINALKIIQRNKDTSMLLFLLEDADDPRVNHRSDFKGMSIYQIKMVTIKSLTGIVPDKEITYKPDSAIIKFYLSKLKKHD